jgi:glucokinase
MTRTDIKNQAPCLLVGDIGGTNVRFALADADKPGFTSKVTYQCEDFQSADQAIGAYLEQIGAPSPQVICIAAAGPVVDGHVLFTNNSWSLDTGELQLDFEGASVRLLNDFEACAFSLPNLQKKDCLRIGSLPRARLGKSDYTIGVIGPGTGLGAAGLCQRGGQVIPLIGEGGHVGFAPESQVQMEILSQLRDEFDRVSDERLVSGRGVVNIYHALVKIQGKKVTHNSAKEIFSMAVENPESIAAEAVQVFYEILGQVAGNLALTLGASDGIYIAGGIVTRTPKLMVNSRFRIGFERKGRHRSMMEKIPTQMILHADPGLLGASYFASQIYREKGSCNSS